MNEPHQIEDYLHNETGVGSLLSLNFSGSHPDFFCKCRSSLPGDFRPFSRQNRFFKAVGSSDALPVEGVLNILYRVPHPGSCGRRNNECLFVKHPGIWLVSHPLIAEVVQKGFDLTGCMEHIHGSRDNDQIRILHGVCYRFDVCVVRTFSVVGKTGKAPGAEVRHVLWEMEFGDQIPAGEFRQELLGDVICAGFFRTVRSIDYGDFHLAMMYWM